MNNRALMSIYIIFLSVCLFVCMYVCYRFSRQPLNRLFWNFAWCFEMGSERQLSILEPIGWKINDLSHNSCLKKGSQHPTLRNGKTEVWRHLYQCVGFIGRQLTSCKYILSDVRDSGSVLTGCTACDFDTISLSPKRVTGNRGYLRGLSWYLHRVAGTHWAGNSLYWPVKNDLGTDTGGYCCIREKQKPYDFCIPALEIQFCFYATNTLIAGFCCWKQTPLYRWISPWSPVFDGLHS